MANTPGMGGIFSESNPLVSQGGAGYYSRYPQQFVPIVLWQGAVPGGAWLAIKSAPRNIHYQIQDIWIANQTNSAMDCYFALPTSATFDHTDGLGQVDVFQICSNVAKLYRETGAYIAVSAVQPIYFYSTHDANMRISGLEIRA